MPLTTPGYRIKKAAPLGALLSAALRRGGGAGRRYGRGMRDLGSVLGREAGVLGTPIARHAIGAAPGETLGGAFAARPVRSVLRGLLGRRMPHGKKILAGAAAVPFMEPLGEGIGRLMNFDDEVYRQIRRRVIQAGHRPPERETYNSRRNAVLREAAAQAVGMRRPTLDSDSMAAAAVRNYGVPVLKEKTRRSVAGYDDRIPFTTLPSWLNPQRTVAFRNPAALSVRERIADTLFRPRTQAGIAAEGTGGMARDYVTSGRAGTTARTVSQAYLDAPERIGMPAAMLADSALRHDTTAVDPAMAAYFAHLLAPNVEYLRNPTNSNTNARLTRRIIDAAPSDVNVRYREGPGSAHYAPRGPWNTGRAQIGLQPRAEGRPGIAAHEVGHHLSMSPDNAYGNAMRNNLRPVVAIPQSSRGLYNISQYRGVPRGGDTGEGFRRALAYGNAAANAPLLFEETRASALGARHAWNALEGENPYLRARSTAGAFGGLPSYYHNALTPLLETGGGGE